MILQALYRLAQDDGLMADPDYEWKPVAWLVRVGKGGEFLGIHGTHEVLVDTGGKKKPKPVPKRFSVPRQEGRTSGDFAFFLCDKAEYVFGMDPGKEEGGSRSSEKLAARSSLFRKRVSDCAAATGDEGVEAALALLETVAAGRTKVGLPAGCAANELFAFVYGPDVDVLMSSRPKVRQHWKELRLVAGGGVGDQTCLVSGRECVPVDKHPPIKHVPGGSTSGIALVSFNTGAFESYGWRGNENATVSREAAEACSTALNRLLDPQPPDPNRPGLTLPRRHLRLSADTVVCYWAAGKASQEVVSLFAPLLEANPDQVKTLYQSIWRGKRPDVEKWEKDAGKFYALTLSGAQGRAVVRGWFESTVAEVIDNLAKHFGDLDIVRNTPKPKEHDLPPQIPLRTLMESLAPMGKSDQIPDALAADFIDAAFRGTPYPLSILQRCLERMRAEIGKDEWLDFTRRDARAALIKAVLNRRRRLDPTQANYQEVKRDMDPNNSSPGYALGRLMAVLERIQQEAIDNPNASVIDRFFSGASATPKAVFVRLLKNARHHVRKARDDRQKGGTIFLLDRLVDELADRFDPKDNGFPAHLDLEQQGLFVLGYHQMRKWLWMTGEERREWEAAHAGVPRAYLWKSGKQEPVSA